MLSTTEQQSISVGWGRFLDDDENFRVAPAVIHSDLNCEHILLDGRSHRLAGVIDWEDAAVGDPALDFAGLLDCGQPFVRSVLAAYGGHGDMGILARAGFYQAIGPCYQVLYGLDVGAQEHVIQGLNGLRTVWARKKR